MKKLTKLLLCLFSLTICIVNNANSQLVNLNVKWLTQDESNCSWSTSPLNMRCGPTCAEMTLAYYNSRIPLSSNVTKIIEDYKGVSAAPCGVAFDYLNIVNVLKDKNMEAQAMTSSNTELSSWAKCINFLYDNFKKNNLIIINVSTKMKASTTTNHWMLAVGIDTTTGEIIVNDPGRSVANQQYADHKRYTLSELKNSWGTSGNRRCILVKSFYTPNQSLQVYAGSNTAPKDFEMYFLKSQINNENPISITNLKVGGVAINATSAVNLNTNWASNIYTFKALPTQNNFTSLANNSSYSLGFDVVTTQGNTYKFYSSDGAALKDKTSLNASISSYGGDWLKDYVEKGIQYGLFYGMGGVGSTDFGGTDELTREQAAKVIVASAIQAHTPNRLIDEANTNNDFSTDVAASRWSYKYIHTLKNWGVVGAGNSFSPETKITLGEFCRWLDLAMKFTASNVNTTNVSRVKVAVPTTVLNYANIQLSMDRISNIVFKNISGLYTGIDELERIGTLADFSLLPPSQVFQGNITVTGTSNMKRSLMAKILTNAYICAYQINNNANPESINDFTIIGDKFENAEIPTGNSITTVSTQTFNIGSGESLSINQGGSNDEYGNPLHYYWSMINNGATLVTSSLQNQTVKFTAPIVTTPTQWKIYCYKANNKGKAIEKQIIVNVGGVVASTNVIPVPTGVFMSASSITAFTIEWDRVSTSITEYKAEYSTDPNFAYGVTTQTFNSSNATIYWNVTGQPTGTYYARVKCMSNGQEGNWSNTATLNFSSNFIAYFDEPNFLPVNNATSNTNSVALKFPALGGNAPLKYTVYFSDFNPLGTTPIVLNSTTNTFTVNNLQYNKDYFWRAKVVDANGDEAWSNYFKVTINPETTPPTGSILIENGAATTNSISVNININVSDAQSSIVGMRFSNDGVSWPSYWEQYNINRPAWNLIGYGGNSNPGTKTVYGQFKDNSGNIATFSDAITLATGVKGNFIVRNKKFESLKAANQYAVVGDTIYATAGYYDLSSEIESSPYLQYSNAVGVGLKNGVSLMGEGAEKTTLFWDGTLSMLGGLGCAGNNLVQGLTITVSKNTSSSRSSIMLHGASNVTIKNCIIKGGDYAISGLNYSSSGNLSNINLYNNIIINNYRYALFLRNLSNANIWNNTINGNGYACVSISTSSSVNFVNNIVSNNSSEAIYIDQSAVTSFINNNVFNNKFSTTSADENYTTTAGALQNQTGSNGNISVDPQYVNAASNNYALQSSSPCINTGTIVGLPYYSTMPDIGAIEYGTPYSILKINSNIASTFVVTYPNGTQQTVTTGQNLGSLSEGVYGIYPTTKVGYYSPNTKFMYISPNTIANTYYGVYVLDNVGPVGEILINGGVYSTQSPYVSIYNNVTDDVNGLTNGKMQFSNDGVTWSVAETITNKKLLWNIMKSSTDTAAGTRYVYAKFADNNGFWSGAIKDSIEYLPNAKIKIIEPNNNVYNLSFRNKIDSSSRGDILLLKKGIHTIFGGGITLPQGITIQGLTKDSSILGITSYINVNTNYKLDNLTLNGYTFQNFWCNITNSISYDLITNCISKNQSMQFNNAKTILANNIFKNITTSYDGFFKFYSNQPTSNFRAYNNVFDASVNNTALTTDELAINFSGMCCTNLFEIKNNIFYGFDLSNGPIKYANSSLTTGDIEIKNNNFDNLAKKIIKFSGVDISKDEFSYSYTPNFNTNYSLPTTSALLNSGNTNLFFNNHNNTTNNIGITGGLYYNTIPNIAVSVEQTGILNEYKITINATDEQTPTNKLQYRWDFNNDGIFDTSFILDATIIKTFNSSTTDSIVAWVFDEHFAMNYVKIANPLVILPYLNNIALSHKNVSICSGSQLKVMPSITGIYSLNNQFDIELSDSTGSFSAPTLLYTFYNQISDSITLNIPNGLKTSLLYKLRIKASNPNLIVTATGTLSITNNPNISVSIAANPSVSICQNSNVVFTATPTNGGTMPMYQWKLNGLNVSTNGNTYSNNTLLSSDLVWVEMTSNAACNNGSISLSNVVNLSITVIDTPFIQAIDNTLAASTDVGVQWYRNGQVITGATSQFYEATQNGFYQVKITINGCSKISAIYNHTYVAQITYSSIDGNIITPIKKPINNVSVKITGDTSINSIQSAALTSSLINAKNYTIRPTKNNDIAKANGVTSVDALLVQRHILNTTKLNNAYKLIAADVDGNKAVNSVDVLRIKRLILGTDTTFKNTLTTENRLWAFVDSAYQFPDTTNPFPFKDSISFTNLTSNKTNQTFIGVKLGDVNFDWNSAVAKPSTVNCLQSTANSQPLTENCVQLVVTNKATQSPSFGGVGEAVFSTLNSATLSALQTTIHFDNTQYEFVSINNNKYNIDFNTTQANKTGNISLVWIDKQGETKTFKAGEELFSLVLSKRSTVSGQQFTDWQLNDDITPTAAFDEALNKKGIILRLQSAVNGNLSAVDGQQWTIYPNPTHSQFIIVGETMADKGQIVITNVLGKQVYKSSINSKQLTIDCNRFAKGLYVVSIITANTKSIQKLVIE